MNKYFNVATVLYVEDEKNAREETAIALQRCSKKLFVAKNGKEGLELYKKHRPDIVIADIKMPIMNGIDMSKAIKKIEPNQQIIITTAHSEEEFLLEAIESQVNGYLLKPIDKSYLQNKVKEIAKNIFRDKELKKNKELLQEITDIQDSMLMVYDKNNKIIFANQMFLNFYNVDSIDMFLDKFNSVGDTFIKSDEYYFNKYSDIRHWTKDIHDFKNDTIVSINETLSNNAKIFLVKCKISDSTEHQICTFSEITTMILEKKELKKRAFIDELTNIPNRAKFNEIVDFEIQRFSRYKHPLSLLMFDIDDFKIINDTYGHQVGDDVLFELAMVVEEYIRSTDLLARWGGEEFMILLPNTNIESSLILAEHLREHIQEHTFKNNLKITCSLGVTQIKINETKDIFLKNVDTAMYKAKQNGKNQVQSYF